MFLGRINDFVTTSANQIIPFITKINSNKNTSNSAGVISLRKAGYYNLDANLYISGVAGVVTATVYADGVPTDNVASATTAVAGVASLSLTDVIRAAISQFPDVATISIVLDTAGVSVDGTVRVEYVK